MKITNQFEHECQKYEHSSIRGDAFAFNRKNRLAVLGGQGYSNIVDLAKPDNILAQIPITFPTKCFVNNYEWDPAASSTSPRFLQTREKLIEIVSPESGDTCQTLHGHYKTINEAKWSPLKSKLLASTSLDSNLFVWSTETDKPVMRVLSCGGADCLSWNRAEENVIAVSSNNDIRLYDLRKPNSFFRYQPNAHTKKIYCLDWNYSSEKTESVLLSSGRDGYVRLWNFYLRHERLMEYPMDNFPCWKARFTPGTLGLCFGVIPVCQSSSENSVKNFMGTKYAYIDPPETKFDLEGPNQQMNIIPGYKDVLSTTYLLLCQISSLDEAKAYRFVSHQSKMVLDFDFCFEMESKFSMISWSRDQHLRLHMMDKKQLVTTNTAGQLSRAGTFNQEDDLVSECGGIKIPTINSNPMTACESRSDSISVDPILMGTPPTTASKLGRDPSITLIDERMLTKSMNNHDILKANPRCFGARFGPLPEQFLIFSNEGFDLTNLNSKENNPNGTKKKKSKHGNKPKYMGGGGTSGAGGLKQSNNSSANSAKNGKVYLFDMSRLINVRRQLAERYLINGHLESTCEHNQSEAKRENRSDIVKIWELLKFVTMSSDGTNNNTFDYASPWSCSMFGRPLVNEIVEACIRDNDIQTAAMIVAKIKQHDKSIKIRDVIKEINEPINSSVNMSHTQDLNPIPGDISRIEKPDENSDDNKDLKLLDPTKSIRFDLVIRAYCELLFKWGLLNKRIELFEYVSRKPVHIDEKFECSTRCMKCREITNKNKSRCQKCKSTLLYCSLCELPVNGISTYCALCGHGGHYDHLLEWFKRHDDCPSACGCRCVDYL